jgi:hypothetical protein
MLIALVIVLSGDCEIFDKEETVAEVRTTVVCGEAAELYREMKRNEIILEPKITQICDRQKCWEPK